MPRSVRPIGAELAGVEGSSPAAGGPQEATGRTSGHEAAREPAEAKTKAGDARGEAVAGGQRPGPREAGAWWERRGGGVWCRLEAAFAI